MIRLRGARQNNLQAIDLDLPLGQLIVFTGVSGSGKSSCAIETLAAEGRRRFVETLSLKLRSTLQAQGRPAFDTLSGLPPTIAVEQHRAGSAGPGASVGTLSDLLELLAILAARQGEILCPHCGVRLRAQTRDEILAAWLALPERTRFTVLAPARQQEAGDHRELLRGLVREGYARVRIDGEIHRVEEAPELDPGQPHDIEVVIDRIRLGADKEERLSDALRLALAAGQGRVAALVGEELQSWAERPHHCGESWEPPARSRLLRMDEEADRAALGERPFRAWLELPCGELGAWIDALDTPLAAVVDECRRRLDFLARVGLSYLSLDRPASSLAPGELQRLRLAGVLGSELSGVLVVLDEPTAGLDQRDTDRLVELLLQLRSSGNTVLVVEHDPSVVRAADQVVDFGPEAGERGGRVVFQGHPEALLASETLTGRWMSGRERAPEHSPRRSQRHLVLEGAHGRNLQADLRVPLRSLTVLTGPSGSGKSSLVLDTLVPALKGLEGLPYAGLRGHDNLLTRQLDPGLRIGGPRSNVATWGSLWGPMRKLLAATREARVNGFGPGHFSLAQPGGRCEACKGQGSQAVDMGPLPEVELPCPVCEGRRFDRATLRVSWRGLSPLGLLELSVGEARRMFSEHRSLGPTLRAIDEVGLSYLQLGRRTSSLSGGEAQRLGLARDLAKGELDRRLLVLDEPCVGLHPRDVADLCRLLHRLVDEGATVLAIEQDPQFLEQADRVLEMDGGRIT
jgi:excinuclease ABC subunit A